MTKRIRFNGKLYEAVGHDASYAIEDAQNAYSYIDVAINEARAAGLNTRDLKQALNLVSKFIDAAEEAGLSEAFHGKTVMDSGQLIDYKDVDSNGHHYSEAISIIDSESGKSLLDICWNGASWANPHEMCIMGQNALRNPYKNTVIAELEPSDFKKIRNLVLNQDAKMTEPWTLRSVKALAKKIADRFGFFGQSDMNPWWNREYDGNPWKDAVDGVIGYEVTFDPHDDEYLAQTYLSPEELEKYYED